jgi:hypothetical protein
MPEQPTAPNSANWQIFNEQTVFSADGDKIGTVREYSQMADYLDVQRGWQFTKDFYVSVSDIRAVDDTGITLRLSKDALLHGRYTTPPVGAGSAGGNLLARIRRRSPTAPRWARRAWRIVGERRKRRKRIRLL